ncbi:sec-independent protein translocase protein TatB [Tamaricihabitans halophyticus]|uniref:Sec-independent protein translocase protein TatB n=1 Tax=Tamaricihabitans halophyticus TaxID=1262583 RepID=A0A4V2SUX5_9PSEU|nr:Sec-independent protein translocase protein TatB [Tamaricihabitans halophyticus]TCP56216.1 sec-independent protein translocase protein TatB [Tamaricihabitans halophyticus]
MFDGVSWGEFLILIVAGLFILGPERLPTAAAWLGRSVRKVREFATGARDQLNSEVGTDLEEFRKPIQDLRQLRNMDPKRAVAKHLFDGDEDPLGMREFDRDMRSNGNGSRDTGTEKPNGAPQSQRSEPLPPGEKPPVDPDAT